MNEPFSRKNPPSESGNAPTRNPPPSWLETPRTRWQLRFGLPLLYWRFPTQKKSVYLTFDDGPVRGVTDQILDILENRQAKATFFCVGRNVEHDPGLVGRIVDLGHSVGNHTYSHLSGWKTSFHDYLADIDRCDQTLPATKSGHRPAFRPPFGQLGVVQGVKLLVKRRIVMWDVNSMDYRDDQTPKMIEDRVCDYVRPGSIVLLHDSAEAGDRTITALPEILDRLGSQGFAFEAI